VKKRIAIQVLSVAVLLEIFLRIFGVNQTFREQYAGTYDYMFNQKSMTWYHTWPPNYDRAFGEDEFTYQNHYNDLGHREQDFASFLEDTSEMKIICIGDSFTEGDGAPYDSSWVRAFERNYLKLDSSVAVYNAGVCGSDVIFDFVILRDKLLAAKPDLVIECLNTSDILDVYYRGDADRFLANGTFRSANTKWWEVLYKYSYVFRAGLLVFGGYDNNLIHMPSEKEDQTKTIKIIAEQVNTTYNLCKENGVNYLLVVLPVPDNIIYRDNIPFKKLIPYTSSAVPKINLFPSLSKSFDTLQIENYSWKKNKHYNSKGYELVGNYIFEGLQDSIPLHK
jgi:lysophospholipase L1-like esterase